MAGSFGAYIGGASTKTSGTSLVITSAVAVPAGSLIVVGFGSVASPGTVSCADSKGNSYSLAHSVDSNRFGALFACRITTALAIGDTITVSNSTSVQPRVATADYFTGVGDAEIATSNGNTFANTNPNPTSGASGTPSAADALVIGLYTGNGPSGDGYSDDTDTAGGSGWTWYDADGTTGGSVSTNQNIRMSYKLATSAAAQTYNPASSMSRNCAIMVAVFGLASGGGATLTADAGSVALAGQTAALLAARRLASSQGSATLAGQSAGLFKQRVLAGGAASFTVTGQAAGLVATRKLVAGSGGRVLNGQAAALLASRRLISGAGGLALGGQAAALSKGVRLSAAAGAFAETGQGATLWASRRILAASGSLTLGGGAAALVRGRRLSADPGSLALAGQAALFLYAPDVPVETLPERRLRPNGWRDRKWVRDRLYAWRPPSGVVGW